MTRERVRLAFLVGPPLVLAAVLAFHPPGGADVFEGVREDVDAWLLVHTVFLVATPLLGIAAFMLLRDLDGRLAAVARVALVFFLVFYTAYEVTVGVGTAVLVEFADGLPPAEQTAVADAIQDYNRNWILADPSLAIVLGSLGWIVAMVCSAIALRRRGAGRTATALLGVSALFAIHPPPVGPVALVCFAAAGLLIERARAREADALPTTASASPVAPPEAEPTPS